MDELHQRALARIRLAESQKARLREQWREAVYVYGGEQWFSAIVGGRPVPYLRADPGQSKAYLNIFQAYVNGAVSMLATGNILPEAVPINDRPESQQKADAVNNLLRYVWNLPEFGIREAVENALLWAVLTGNAFLQTVWDLDAGEIYVEDETGIRKVGCPKVVALSPFHVGWNTSVPLRESPWAYIAQALPVQDVVERFGLSESEAPEPDATVGQMPLTSSVVHSEPEATGIKTAVMVYEYWERPSNVSPNGLYAVFTRDRLLYVGEWPTRIMPLVHLKLYNAAGSNWGGTPFHQAIPVQQELNRVVSDVLDNASRINAPSVLAPKGTLPQPPTFKPAAKIEYEVKPGQPTPVVTQIPALPQWVIPFIDRLVHHFEQVTGVQAVIFGEAPFSRVSGRTYSLMLEQVSRQYFLPAQRLAYALCDVARQVIELWQRFGPREVSVRIAPDQPEVLINAGLLDGPHLLNLTPTDVLSVSKQTKINELKELVQLGILKADQFLELAADLGVDYRRADTSYPDRQFVRRFIVRVKSGDLSIPPQWETVDPNVAVKEIGGYLKLREAESLTPQQLEVLMTAYRMAQQRLEAQPQGEPAPAPKVNLPPELSGGMPIPLQGSDVAEDLTLGVPPIR